MGRRALVIGIVVVLLLVLAAVLWRLSTTPPPPPAPPVTGFQHGQVPIVSPDLDFVVVDVRGEVGPRSSRWSCVLECREPAGCHAVLRVTVHYRSGPDSRTITFADTVHVDRAAQAVFGGVQRPPVPVDDVERVEVVVEQRLSSEQQTPRIQM